MKRLEAWQAEGRCTACGHCQVYTDTGGIKATILASQGVVEHRRACHPWPAARAGTAWQTNERRAA